MKAELVSRPGHGLRCIPALLCLAAFGIAACGSDPTTVVSPGAATTANASEPAGGGEAGGGEAPGVRFVSSRFHYRVDAPGTMTEAVDGTASAARGVEQLTIRVVSGPSASDPDVLARSDSGTLPSSTTGYRTVTALASVQLAGRSVPRIVYSSTGTNPVTSKSEMLVTARYYIPRDSSTLAVVSYSILSSQYDPQGADDVAATFSWQ